MTVNEYWQKQISDATKEWEPQISAGEKIETYYNDNGSGQTNRAIETFLRYEGITKNEFFIYVDMMLALLAGKDPKFVAEKFVSLDNNQDVSTIERMCYHYWKVKDVASEIEVAVKTALMYPFSAIKTYISSVDKRKTNIEFVHPSNLIIDPTAKDTREKNIDWIAEKRSIPLRVCKSMKMDETEELEKIVPNTIPSEYTGNYCLEFYEIWDKLNKRILYLSLDTGKIHLTKQAKYFDTFSVFSEYFFPYTILHYERTTTGTPIAPIYPWRRRVFAYKSVMSALVDSLVKRYQPKLIYDKASGLSQKDVDDWLNSEKTKAIGFDFTTSKFIPQLVSDGNVNARPLQFLIGLMDSAMLEETGITRIDRGQAPGSRETATYTANVVNAARTRSGSRMTKTERFVGTIFTKMVYLWSKIGYDYKYANGVEIDKSIIFPCQINVLSASMASPNQLFDIQSLEAAFNVISLIVQSGNALQQIYPDFNIRAAIDLVFERLNIKSEITSSVEEPSKGLTDMPSPVEGAKDIMSRLSDEEIRSTLAEDPSGEELLKKAAVK